MNKNKVVSATLATMSVVGVVGTAVLAGKASIKANTILNKEENKELPVKDKVLKVAPIFIPTVAAGAATVTCILGNGYLSKRHQAMITSSYAAVNEAFKNYRQAVLDDPDAGEEKDKQYFEACRKYSECHLLDDFGPDQKITWYEPISGTYFDAYEREVMDAEYHINRNYILRGYIGIDEYFEFLGLNVDWNPKLDIGWSIDSEIYWLDFEHEMIFDKELGKKVAVISAIWSPTEDYMEGWR